jgi:hypothetical protein
MVRIRKGQPLDWAGEVAHGGHKAVVAEGLQVALLPSGVLGIELLERAGVDEETAGLEVPSEEGSCLRV